MTDQIFIWENIPGNDYDRESLCNFLKQKFYRWKWLEHAEIKKTEEGNIIISYGLNAVLITMHKERRRAVLSFRGRTEFEINVRKVGDKFALDVLTKKRVKEQYIIPFLISYLMSVPKFIISLIPLYGIYSPLPDMKVLGQDKRFTQMLRKTKYRFDRTYKNIIEN